MPQLLTIEELTDIRPGAGDRREDDKDYCPPHAAALDGKLRL